jgi:hypothetical protein
MNRLESIRAVLYIVIGVLLAILLLVDTNTTNNSATSPAAVRDDVVDVPCDRDMLRYDISTLKQMIDDNLKALPTAVLENRNEAWAFVLEHDDAQRHYSTAVLAHVRAIRHWSFVKRPIVLLIDERMALAKDDALQRPFVDEGVTVQTFRGIHYDRSRLLMLKNVNRLHLWRLPFDRVVFVAPEVALLRNLEYLFQYPDFAVVPNSETPDQFRTSLMVLRPSDDTFARMIRAIATYQPSWDTSEQAFLAQFFNNTQALLPWSSCPSVRALYMRPELWDFRDITCLHWSQFQPWTWQKRTDLLYLLFHWYDYLARYVPEYEVGRDDYAPGWPRKKSNKKDKKKSPSQ